MNNKILTLILLVFCIYNLQAQDILRIYCPHPEINEDSCGYVNSNNEIIIPAGKYARLYSSSFDKIAFVSLKGKKGIYTINRTEEILFEVYCVDNGPDNLSQGLFRMIKNDKIGFADMNGKIIISPQFQFVFPFQNNGIAIFNKGGILVRNGDYTYYQGGKWGAINKKGEIILPAQYEDGRNMLLKRNGKWYNVNELIK